MRKKKTRKMKGGVLVGDIIIAPEDTDNPNEERQKLKIISMRDTQTAIGGQIFATVKDATQADYNPATGATEAQHFEVSLTLLLLAGWTNMNKAASTGSTSGGRKKTRKKRGGGKCASKPAVEDFDLDEAIENMKGNRKRLQEIIDDSTVDGVIDIKKFNKKLQEKTLSQSGGKRRRKRGKRKKRTSRRKKKIKNKKKYYIKNPKTPPKKIKCCAGPGCPEHLHCINVIGDGSKKYPFVYKKKTRRRR
jgi:hypothetical protein